MFHTLAKLTGQAPGDQAPLLPLEDCKGQRVEDDLAFLFLPSETVSEYLLSTPSHKFSVGYKGQASQNMITNRTRGNLLCSSPHCSHFRRQQLELWLKSEAATNAINCVLSSELSLLSTFNKHHEYSLCTMHHGWHCIDKGK